MKLRVAVIDTNVVVSGLLTADPAAPPARILDGMQTGRFLFLLSPELLSEYRQVLLRPALRTLHGLDEHEVDEILAEIVVNGIIREPAPSPEPAPDSGDDHVWALAAAFPGSALVVTGDRALLEAPSGRFSVVSPRAYVDLESG